MTRTSLNIRIANAMQGAALHVWNLMQVNTERVLTAQDIARHYAAMGRKNPTQSKYYISELTRVQWPYERTAGEGEGWTYNDEGCINITVDNFACRLWDTGIFAILARFEVIAGIKPANRVRFTRIEAEELPTAPEVAPVAEVEELPAVEVVEVETVAEVAPVAEVEELPAVEGVKMWLISTFAAVAACLIVLISLSIKPRTTATAAATVATIEEPTMVEPTMVECETIDHINEVICTGSIDPYIEKVKEEITAYYRESRESQLQEIADNNNEIFAAIEAADVEPVADEITPIYSNSEELEEIADTLTEEESDTADTITEDQSDTADTLTDGSTYDYSCNGYTVIVVESYDSNGEFITASYVVPLNE